MRTHIAFLVVASYTHGESPLSYRCNDSEPIIELQTDPRLYAPHWNHFDQIAHTYIYMSMYTRVY